MLLNLYTYLLNVRDAAVISCLDSTRDVSQQHIYTLLSRTLLLSRAFLGFTDATWFGNSPLK